MIIKLTQAHIIGAFISYLIGVFIVPFVIEFSQKEGLVDLPNARKIHKIPISRLGGVAIWSSAMLTFLFLVLLSYYPYGSLLSGILLGGSLMFLLGLVDDVYNLDAKFKLVIQLSIATIVYLCLHFLHSTLILRKFLWVIPAHYFPDSCLQHFQLQA